MSVSIEDLARYGRRRARLTDSSGRVVNGVLFPVSRNRGANTSDSAPTIYGVVYFSSNDNGHAQSSRLGYIPLNLDSVISIAEEKEYRISIQTNVSCKKRILPNNIVDRSIIPALLESYGFKPR